MKQVILTRLSASKAILMGKVFLSYSRADSLDFARELHRRFVRDGIDCFFDEASIGWGDHFVLSLEKGLDDCEHIIVVLSPGFVNSEWTNVERTSTCWMTMFRDL